MTSAELDLYVELRLKFLDLPDVRISMAEGNPNCTMVTVFDDPKVPLGYHPIRWTRGEIAVDGINDRWVRKDFADHLRRGWEHHARETLVG